KHPRRSKMGYARTCPRHTRRLALEALEDRWLPASPVITWPVPAAIGYGTSLGASQLDATADVPGTFAYSPPAGAILAAGQEGLQVTFQPTDTVNYSSVVAGVTLTVKPAPLTVSGITANDKTYDGTTTATV